ncbi:MAG: hypothetical protein Q9217_003176 [Psora testacea]
MSTESPNRLSQRKHRVIIPFVGAFANWKAPGHQFADEEGFESNGDRPEQVDITALSRSPSLVNIFVDKSSKMYSVLAQKVTAAQHTKENITPSDQPKAPTVGPISQHCHDQFVPSSGDLHRERVRSRGRKPLRSTSLQSMRSISANFTRIRDHDTELPQLDSFLGRHPSTLQLRSVSLPPVLEGRASHVIGRYPSLHYNGPERPGYTKVRHNAQFHEVFDNEGLKEDVPLQHRRRSSDTARSTRGGSDIPSHITEPSEPDSEAWRDRYKARFQSPIVKAKHWIERSVGSSRGQKG